MQDLRPDGLLGRAFARENAAVLQVGEDPRTWSDDDALYALSLLGADLSGNFIIGEAAYRLWLEQLQLDVVTDAQLEQAYPEQAQRAMEQGVTGTSAGGEFPKFTAVREHGGAPAHVIVKFSGSDESPGTERWSDLLVCELASGSCRGSSRRRPASTEPALEPSSKCCASTATVRAVVRLCAPGPRSTTTGSA